MTRRIVIVCALLIPAPLSAQIGVIVRAGALLTTDGVGPAVPADGPWYLNLEERRDPAASLEASVTLPVASRFEARITGFGTLESSAHGFFACYDGLGCPAILLESAVDRRTLAALAELTWAPLGDRFRPYAIAGAGVRHDAYAWDADLVGFVGHTRESTTSFLIRLGAGLAFVLAGTTVHLELADHWSPAASLDAPNAPGRVPERSARHDLSLTAGIRVF